MKENKSWIKVARSWAMELGGSSPNQGGTRGLFGSVPRLEMAVLLV